MVTKLLQRGGIIAISGKMVIVKRGTKIYSIK